MTVTDGKGVPVTDSTAADFNVKEGGRDHEVVKAGLATTPFHLALIVDDNGTGIFRVESLRFIRRLYGQGDFALTTVVGQPMKLVDYTANIEALAAGLPNWWRVRRRARADSCCRESTRRHGTWRRAKRLDR